MLEEAKCLLQSTFTSTIALLKDSKYHIDFVKEKIVHSYQVLGAANFIIKHEPWFEQQAADFIELAKTAVLLHDIGRFEEAYSNYKQTAKVDHGPAGAALLAKTKAYNNILITLPIKHHGHIIADLYNDAEYQAIKEPMLKEQVTKITFLVRDADKIANFNLMTSAHEAIEPLFVPYTSSVPSGEISSTVAAEFLSSQTITYKNRETQADHLLTYISWCFDINYNSSFEFCQKLNILKKLFQLLSKYHHNEKLNIGLQLSLHNFIKQKI